MEELALDPTLRYVGVEHLSRDGLFCLAGELSRWHREQQHQPSGALLFVINTISEIEPSGAGIEVRGVCSPFLRAKQ
jgi:hypothetical protein